MEPTWTINRLRHLIASRLKGRKFIVVSNREPFVHQYNDDGSIECVRPASGMATALHPIMMASGGTWIAHASGSADHEVVDGSGRIPVPPAQPRYQLRRIWLKPEIEKGFYSGMANEGLWPLCHITFTRPVFRQDDWDSYREANRVFAQAVMDEAAGEKAFVFIQDYHFCLLPQMLRKMGGGRIVCAQFWHIPWPNREIFRTFPWGEELLEGMLGNDLLAFHIHYHCQNFLDTVDRQIEARVDADGREVTRRGHVTRVRPFPISIDFDSESIAAQSQEVTDAKKQWLAELPGLSGRKVVASIERLDYSKGIPQRLEAVEDFLENHPEWRSKVCFVQVAVPSRSQLASYQLEEDAVMKIADRINAQFGKPDWQPVYILKEHHDSVEMAALHRLADVFMVNSLHDGMNLVAKEFVASRSDCRGVLVLSRFTGASRELTQALGVNPYAIQEIAGAIHQALTMSPRRQQRRMRMMREQVSHQNVYRWAGRFLMAMLRTEPIDDEDDEDESRY